MIRARLAALIVAAGCARAAPDTVPGTGDSGPPADRVAEHGGDRVTLERRPCFGSCPVYTVGLERGGAVRFDGRRFVADTGVTHGLADPARTDSLFRGLDPAVVFAWADRYGMGDPGCERYATDLPTLVTELTLGGRTKRIEHDYGCAGAPAALTGLERAIEDVAGVRRWVGR